MFSLREANITEGKLVNDVIIGYVKDIGWIREPAEDSDTTYVTHSIRPIETKDLERLKSTSKVFVELIEARLPAKEWIKAIDSLTKEDPMYDWEVRRLESKLVIHWDYSDVIRDIP